MAAPAPEWLAVVLDTWRAGQDLGAVGPGPVETHLAHAEALHAVLPGVDEAVDLGSGAGVPGLALAALRPTTSWLLVDAAARRVRLLDRALDELGWRPRVQARHLRAEELGRDPAHRGRYGLVVARSFGPPAVTAECGAALLADGGVLAVTEPPTAPPATDSRWPAAGLEALGLVADRLVETPVRVQFLVRRGPLPDNVPRRPGIPAKRPRF